MPTIDDVIRTCERISTQATTLATEVAVVRPRLESIERRLERVESRTEQVAEIADIRRQLDRLESSKGSEVSADTVAELRRRVDRLESQDEEHRKRLRSLEALKLAGTASVQLHSKIIWGVMASGGSLAVAAAAWLIKTVATGTSGP